ncbi:polymorphic toxin type 33 domain-containing protein [Photorhabdus sp. CRCIA-P01]|uniref:polymorphic toxin type 33 domain-containing protein n=1 Tax=Photorhabdus sp. CRCIA-P01 TaxID=2019570 RepID=UPI001E51756A|nr:polymorphic toxin type 33 domain-containing protein [Photorhabdus sp. CRCIA-P01]
MVNFALECVVTDNNALAVPMPPPAIAGSNTGEAVNEANQTIASALDKKLKEIGETLDKATECSFGRVCSSSSTDDESNPNIGKSLTNEEKREYGGTGTGNQQPPEDNQNKNGQSENKPSNIKMADDKYLKNNGIDAHELKSDVVGKKNISKYDIYVNKETGELWVFRKGGTGEGIPTGEFIK